MHLSCSAKKLRFEIFLPSFDIESMNKLSWFQPHGVHLNEISEIKKHEKREKKELFFWNRGAFLFIYPSLRLLLCVKVYIFFSPVLARQFFFFIFVSFTRIYTFVSTRSLHASWLDVLHVYRIFFPSYFCWIQFFFSYVFMLSCWIDEMKMKELIENRYWCFFFIQKKRFFLFI